MVGSIVICFCTKGLVIAWSEDILSHWSTMWSKKADFLMILVINWRITSKNYSHWQLFYIKRIWRYRKFLQFWEASGAESVLDFIPKAYNLTAWKSIYCGQEIDYERVVQSWVILLQRNLPNIEATPTQSLDFSPQLVYRTS